VGTVRFNISGPNPVDSTPVPAAVPSSTTDTTSAHMYELVFDLAGDVAKISLFRRSLAGG
jgi:hypothetical protein